MYKAQITLINRVEILQTNEIDQYLHFHLLKINHQIEIIFNSLINRTIMNHGEENQIQTLKILTKTFNL